MKTFAKSLSSMAVWVALLLIMGLATSFGQVTLSLPNVTALPGSTLSIAVNVAIPSGQSVGSFEFEVLCDSTVTKFTGIEATGTLTNGNPPTANWYVGVYNAGRMKMTWASVTPLVGNGVLIYVKATGRSSTGNTSLQLSKAYVWDSNTSPLQVSTTNGSVTLGTSPNQRPSFVTKLRDTTINQGSTLTRTLTATDPDAGTVIVFSLLNAPSGASINSSGLFTFTPPANPARTYSIVAIASDGALADTSRATVTVNRKPTIVSKSPATLTNLAQKKSQVFSVSTVNPDGGALTFQWKLNGVVDKSGSDSTYTKTFTDPNGTAKTLGCVASNSVGLKDSVTWNFTITRVEKNDGVIPVEFALGQNYPNPFNPSTTIQFDLPKEALVTLEIYNVLGVRVRSLVTGQAVSAGTHSMAWDGRNDDGITMPSGVYLYRISAGDFQASRKMTMVK